ncbi:hypothetical protein DY000_02022147 [Brassica cretica]|uniref:HECT domain-containing protein n=1 Tax=Brassica cretica TaxID=69181 RepID=A0ABQ7E4E8_BRACR|nr:hypothetical protein DY000_02022147 [Brassica cretica]
MEAPPRDQTSLWGRRGRIGRREKGSRATLIPHFSNGVMKYRVRNRCFSQPFAMLRALLIAVMIDKGEEYMEEAFTKD